MLFDTGQMLIIFIVGSVATVAGTLLSFKLLPLAALGNDSWKVSLGCDLLERMWDTLYRNNKAF